LLLTSTLRRDISPSKQLCRTAKLALPIQDIKIQNGSSYDHKGHFLNSSIVVRCLDRLQPNEIRSGEFSEANANTDADPNGSAENSPGVRTNSGETIANATAESNASGDSIKSDACGGSKSAEANAVDENFSDVRSAKSEPHAGADRGETDSHACASSRRKSLSRSPGRELERQKISPRSERKGSCAYAVPRLGSKEYRRRQHLNVYRYEER
jgi:hypothetical protein